MLLQGDQGAPLACPSFDSGKYLLVGALSGGAECGAEGIPDIYTLFAGEVQKWARDTLMERFGEVDVPLPKVNSSQSAAAAGGVTNTAGGFYYDDGKCHGYEARNIPVSGLRT